MSKTIQQVHEAFSKGKAAHTGRGSLDSDSMWPGEATALRSYRTVIGIRRDRDEAVFYDGHSYSNTTTRHQAGARGRATFSFDCVAELMGSRWWERAVVADWGPRDCTDPACEQETDDLRALFDEGRIKDYPYRKCFAPNEGDLHEVKIEGYDGWYGTAVLLAFDGQRVLCGFERGKRSGTDQLWAALLPMTVDNVRQAFLALQPRLSPGFKRQGDLYFDPCENGDGPPKGATALDGAPLPLGEERANHRASRVRIAFDGYGYTGNRGNRGFGVTTPACRIWARGNVDHPEHPRLRLGHWHRVYRSAAVRAVSSAYRHGMGSGRGAQGD